MMWINLAGFLLIALIAWWFWFYQAKGVEAQSGQAVEILVHDGVYEPARVQVPQGQPVELVFLRQDASPCAAMVEFPDFGISRELLVNKKTSIHLPAMLPGEYPFHCQMNMYQGSLLVK